jgi:hypothetical protein
MSYVIDVHHHILPDFFWRETNEGASPVGGIAPPPWDQAGALSFMDDAGIDVAVTSISAPGFMLETTRERVTWLGAATNLPQIWCKGGPIGLADSPRCPCRTWMVL